MKKFIFFDNDGVLVDTEKYYYQANKSVLLKVGIELSEADFAYHSLILGSSIIKLARAKNLSENEIKKLVNERNHIYSGLIENENLLNNNVKNLLEFLRDKIKMGIVTSSRKSHFEKIHKSTGILDYFEFILTREDYENSKPSPEPYLKALELSGCTPEECFVIEDTPRGFIAAKEAGIECLVIKNHFLTKEQFPEECKFINSLDDIKNYI